MNNRRRLINKLKRKMLLDKRRKVRLKIFEHNGPLIKDVYDAWLRGIELKNDLEYGH